MIIILRTETHCFHGRYKAVSGLGGIGKTQVAIEYAYRYHHEYEFTLWVRAATPETLAADFLSLANLLQLPEQNEQNQWSLLKPSNCGCSPIPVGS